MGADGALLFVHRDAGEVAHMLIAAGELVKQGGFSAVGISYQGKREIHEGCTSMLLASSRRSVSV